MHFISPWIVVDFKWCVLGNPNREENGAEAKVKKKKKYCRKRLKLNITINELFVRRGLQSYIFFVNFHLRFSPFIHSFNFDLSDSFYYGRKELNPEKCIIFFLFNLPWERERIKKKRQLITCWKGILS